MSAPITIGDPLPLQIKAVDGNTALYPRALIYGAGNTPLATRDLVHAEHGLYRDATFLPTTPGIYAVAYQIFADAGRLSLDPDYEQPSDVFIVALADEEPMLAANYVEALDELRLVAWLLRSGTRAQDVTSVAVTVQAGDDDVVYSASDLAPDGQGVFRVTVAGPGLVAGAIYTATITITLVGGRQVSGLKSFKAVI